jgi:hypothetical protein
MSARPSFQLLIYRAWVETERYVLLPTVRAEAQRQVRTIDLPAEHATALVDLLVDEVLDRRYIASAPPHDGLEEPAVLRRVDGTSVYTIAGAELYTSRRILDPEARLVDAAGRHDGVAVEHTADHYPGFPAYR